MDITMDDVAAAVGGANLLQLLVAKDRELARLRAQLAQYAPPEEHDADHA